MYLKEITLQGFKTFAKKTTLRFVPEDKTTAITAIVGPNGSGKSNVADAIRWVLGEQRMKHLRGKSATDVIFSGSDGKSRAGFAEVAILFGDVVNIDGIDFAELTITRRLYRDGESQYLVNGKNARLADIHMILAQANVGQRSYSVVGQGQIDHILAASPEERKSFFDDATGVKPLQLKRHEALLKIKRTRENLQQTEMLVQELTPRLSTLRRLVKRLNEREEVEKQLHQAQIGYYGTLWRKLQTSIEAEKIAFNEAKVLVDELNEKRKQERERFAAMEREESNAVPTSSPELSELQSRYDALQDERNILRDKQFELHKQLELAKVKSVSSWTPLPLSKIIEGIRQIKEQLNALREAVKNGNIDQNKIDETFNASSNLLDRLQKPAPEKHEANPQVVAEMAALKTKDQTIVAELTAIKQSMHSLASSAKKEKQELFALQNRLNAVQEDLHRADVKFNDRRVALARLETRQEDLERDMREVLGEYAAVAKRVNTLVNTDELYPNIQRLRHKLDLIGGIDEETVKEYEEAQIRHAFLEEQSADLMQALHDTEKIIKELDEQIKSQSAEVFKEIQSHFTHYFKILFGGGSCSLTEIKLKDLEREEDEDLEDTKDTDCAEDPDRVVGVEIQATPPGKRMKSINLLSGGERALTSIALISAIMATNPSPFVVLDEVDAALDEANTWRFAKIVEELAEHTQFILITHNRATMQTADLLYGVSMQNDGVSQLLSVKLAQIEEFATTRR